MLESVRAIPFEILRGGGMETKNKYGEGGSLRKKNKNRGFPVQKTDDRSSQTDSPYTGKKMVPP